MSDRPAVDGKARGLCAFSVGCDLTFFAIVDDGGFGISRHGISPNCQIFIFLL